MKRRRKHARRGRGIGIRWLPALLAFSGVLVLLLAGAAYAGYRYDRAAASKILPGVRVAAHTANDGTLNGDAAEIGSPCDARVKR